MLQYILVDFTCYTFIYIYICIWYLQSHNVDLCLQANMKCMDASLLRLQKRLMCFVEAAQDINVFDKLRKSSRNGTVGRISAPLLTPIKCPHSFAHFNINFKFPSDQLNFKIMDIFPSR